MISKDKLAKLLFPHSKVREIQKDMILDVDNAIKLAFGVGMPM